MPTQTLKERKAIVWDDVGAFQGASLNERFVYDDGSTRNGQRALTEQEADDLIGTVEADLIETVATLTEDIATLTAAATASAEQITTLTSERDASLADAAGKATEIATLTAAATVSAGQIATLTADAALSQTAIATLTSERDALAARLAIFFDVRKIRAEAWQKRFTRREIRLAAVADDATVRAILRNLKQLEDDRELLDLDAVPTVNAVNHLVAIGVIEADRVAAILADAQQNEQY